MKQALTLITLAVEDLPRALAFYRDGLGWTPSFTADNIAFFQMNGFAFSLFKQDEMAKELGRDIAVRRGGIALAHNVESPEAVDALLSEIRKLKGGAILSEPVKREWGGYSGYFEDPDGHAWEVAWNPYWTLSPEGFVTI